MTCRCGKVMTEASLTGISYCENCDVLQPQQLLGFPRVVSASDKEFEYAFNAQVREWYPEQFKQGGM